MIEGGWVCRACWQPNGPAEDRCYRCKTPRDAQLAVEAGSSRERAEVGSELKGRMDAELPILALVTAWPLRIFGGAEIGLGMLILLLALLSRGEGPSRCSGWTRQSSSA